MKVFIVIGYVFCVLGLDVSYAQSVAPVASPVAVASTAPVVAPVAAIPASQASPVVVKDDSAAPPTWMQDVLVSIKKLPMIGPIVVKALNWVGVLCSILTALAAFLMVALKALSSVMNLAQATDLAAKVQGFQDGKIMYYLKYLSMFNAQKPDASAPAEKAA